MPRSILVALVLVMASGSARGANLPESVTIERDEIGIPHVFAPTLETAAFGIGYAQAEDRLEELLKNYRRASGTMAEVFGPEFFESDLAQRVWRHAEISREKYHEVSPKLRAVFEAYQAGIKQFMKEHPEQVPSWAQEIHPWDIVALSRYIIWGWPLGEAMADLKRAGIDVPPQPYRGSNEMLIAPRRTAMGAPIAVIDPHLSWYGSFRFYEERIYGGDYAVSGVCILGAPLPSLGHSRYCSVAMTTGGPDTSDVYEEELNPTAPLQYKYDGAWRNLTVRRERIGVKEGDRVAWREVEILSSHHGPLVLRKGNKAYAVAIPYRDEVGLSDQVYAMMTARNLEEMKRALSLRQLMAQNVMVGTVQGEIYYLRNGRVPVRAKGVDPSRPVPGNTSATEWQGIHPLEDLVQVTNPPTGWMQNCNVSPFAMMTDSPLVPEKYAGHPYLYNAERTPPHQRAAMMNDLLAGASHVTVEQAIRLAFNTQVWHAERWQARIKQAWTRSSTISPGKEAKVYDLIQAWNGQSDPDSPGALAYYAFRKALRSDLAKEVDPPAGLADGEIVLALREAATWLSSTFGALDVPFGRYFRVGRDGGDRSWPVGGGSLRDVAMATPRAIGFEPSPDHKRMIGHSGQTSTQVVILTNPPQSYAVIPLGESDHKQSGHWDDQAEKLFSKGLAAPTYFLDHDALRKHVTTSRVLHYAPNGSH